MTWWWLLVLLVWLLIALVFGCCFMRGARGPDRYRNDDLW